jgi:hypothetical protein
MLAPQEEQMKQANNNQNLHQMVSREVLLLTAQKTSSCESSYI